MPAAITSNRLAETDRKNEIITGNAITDLEGLMLKTFYVRFESNEISLLSDITFLSELVKSSKHLKVRSSMIGSKSGKIRMMFLIRFHSTDSNTACVKTIYLKLFRKNLLTKDL